MKTTGIIFGFIFFLAQEKVFALQAWQEIQAKLDKVYRIYNDQNTTELLRTYKDGTYELLRYTKVPYKADLVARNLGRFVQLNAKIIFERPEIQEFESDFNYGSFYLDGDLYSKRLDLMRGAKFAKYHKSKDKNFLRPFYFSLGKLKLVSNQDVQDHVDFPALVNYLVKDKKTQRDKAMELMQFLVESVEYDYVGLQSGTYWDKPINLKRVLASDDRTTVCAGYAAILKELSSLAGVNCQVVHGETKYNHADINTFAGSHAWNLLELDGKKVLVDVTWADHLDYMDMKWIDVQPSVMIGTHFPSDEQYQLLTKPISKSAFTALPIVIPLGPNVKAVETKLQGKMFVKNQFRIGFKGRHNIAAQFLPEGFTKRVYNTELRDSALFYTMKSIGKVVYDKDSTYLICDLNDQISALTIKVDNQLEIKTIVCKGSQEDLLKHYLKEATSKQSVPFVLGIIAAIKLNDMDALKRLVGASNAIFFDSKGKLNLNKQVLNEFNSWNGEVPNLTITHTLKDFLKNGSKASEISSYAMVINAKMSIELNCDENGYSIKQLSVNIR